MTKDKEPKYNKARLLAPGNTDCVAVPVSWIRQLIAIGSKVNGYSSSSSVDQLIAIGSKVNGYSSSSSVDHLKGYIESAEGFIKRQDDLADLFRREQLRTLERIGLKPFYHECYHCGRKTVQIVLGDPCYCGSDNCSKCVECGKDWHD